MRKKTIFNANRMSFVKSFAARVAAQSEEQPGLRRRRTWTPYQVPEGINPRGATLVAPGRILF